MPSIINEYSGDLCAGQMLGRYELLMPIGKGGMGNVWAARLKGTRGFRKLVAVKTVLRTLENPQLEQMFFQEATLASQIHHPNVAETFELGEHEGTLYLVMELVAGESLLFMLREAQPHGGVPLAVSVNLVGQVCRGLAAAHDLRDETGQRIGLVHRDISPPNVLVTDTGTVKIVDFGVATTASSSTCGSGEIKGKISYLAPEQLRGESLDARVDVFATGILLYLLTVGRHPFRCAGEAETIARILSDVPATPPSSHVKNYPVALEQVVLRALDKNRETRFASITELLEALEDACPSAFGPRADELVTSYVQNLMKERLQERRATLRVAEEWAETSSARHSVASLPAVAASPAPEKKGPRAAWFGAGGMLMGLAVAAVVGTVYLRSAPDAPRTVAASSPAPAADADRSETVVANLPAPTILDSGSIAPADAPTVGAAEQAADSTRPTTRASERRKQGDTQSEETQAGSLPETAEDAAPAAPATDDATPPAEPSAVSPPPTPQLAPPVSPSLIPSRQSPAFAGPRLLASKIGHRQLLTNPRSKAVRLPAALQQSGQTFSASVNICVDARGEVTKVTVARSAGPALDPQIVELISRWKYRPLNEGGRPMPFCYPMKYQVEP